MTNKEKAQYIVLTKNEEGNDFLFDQLEACSSRGEAVKLAASTAIVTGRDAYVFVLDEIFQQVIDAKSVWKASENRS